MDVHLTVPRDDFDEDALERCVFALAEIVERPDDVRLTVTTDFVAAVREKMDPDQAAAYEQDRHFAFTMGKVMPQADGTTDLIIDARVLGRAVEPGLPEQLFRHEAHHIAIKERGESLTDLLTRHEVDHAAGRIYLAGAGNICEEFRVESAMWRTTPEHQPDRLAGFAPTAVRLDDRVREVSRAHQNNPDVGATSDAVMEAFGDVATWTAYLAAEVHVTGRAPAPDVPSDVDDRVLGDPWRALVAELARLPAGDVIAKPEDLDILAIQVAGKVASWIIHIGFAWDVTDDGDLYFHILKPHQWVP
jgi:hypothetical protein